MLNVLTVLRMSFKDLLAEFSQAELTLYIVILQYQNLFLLNTITFIKT